MHKRSGGTPPITAPQILGVSLGNALEFYDFLVFTFFAVEIGQAFFPSANPVSSLLAALATFGAGFLTRPLGAIVIGRLGDRAGRRPAMLLSFALIGLSSLGVALLPSYTAIGMAAPILVILLRLVQGFALGGEVGPSTAFLAEAAPPGRRALYLSLQSVGQYAAVLVAGLIGTALAATMSDAMLAAWGWRIAMLIGVVVVPIGLALRGSLHETLETAAPDAAPPAFASYARIALIGFLLMLSGTITTYVLNYMTTYAKTVLKLPSGIAFGASVAVGIAGMAGSLAGGWLADRIGRQPVILWPTAIATLATLPGFWLVTHYPGAASLYTASFVLRALLAAAFAAALATITEGFPPRVRSGTLAIVYALAISIFGGTTQFVVAWLTDITGDPLSPAWYMAAAGALGVIAVLFVPRTAPPRVRAG